jgi:Phosphatidylserine/phosphatidylglycerophosphate/cardiolipin synthases and related enzymes
VVGTITLLLSLVVSADAVLHKQDSRAVVGWVGLIWLVPILGAVLYVLFGINRIKRRAIELRQDHPHRQATAEEHRIDWATLAGLLPEESRHLITLARLVDQVTCAPLTGGNRVIPLVNGDAAYPAMLDTIEQASASIALSTYIFDNDRAGRMFADTLARAVERGLEVRVLVDEVGSRYSFPSIVATLQKRRIRVARSLGAFLPWRMPYMNLRHHRKILVVDGRIGFTGGMNIREGHMLGWGTSYPIQDMHFRFEGPVVAPMMRAFMEDWAFSTSEVLEGEVWFPQLKPVGPVAARGIVDGPDEDLEKIRWTKLGALSRSQRSVRIVTPYFLPDEALITSLNVAAMRGVQVDIVLPEINNLQLVKWACTAQLWQVLKYGCRIWLSPPPFDHTKLMLVDGAWALVGSANWDPRSLRLNFEFNVECYDIQLVAELDRLVDEKIKEGRTLTLDEVNGRNLPIKLRDGVARLFSPYL